MSHRFTAFASRPLVFLGAIGLIALAIVAAPALNTGPRSALAADPTATNEHVITVSGTGKVTVKPDLADVNLGVTTQANTAKAARDEAATKMNAILAALKNLGIADEDIQTSNISINPVYDYNSSSPNITGYQVTNQVDVHVRDITKVADVIDDSVAAGATNVNYVSFDVADRTSAENQARTAAVNDAKSHADALATAAGVTITGVQSISDVTVSYPYPVYGVADSAGKGGTPAAPSVPTPVQPGTQDITITVTVSYLI
ncbi:MAG TPA: SIMPL domain-containing protein [Candidatus Limnocylindrales bacterium]|jgi:hypothetical protein